MFLKEAYRMQNYLDDLMDQAQRFLLNSNNVMNKTEEHLMHKANPNAENETVDVPKDTDLLPNKVIAFMMDLIDEKEKLTNAIVTAKKFAEIDLDSSLAMNKVKQSVASIMKSLANLKASEVKSTARGYLIDGEGKQSPYTYDVLITSTIDYDRNVVKSNFKKLSKESDDVSNKADQLLVSLKVNYTPKYEIGDSFEEALELL